MKTAAEILLYGTGAHLDVAARRDLRRRDDADFEGALDEA
jgi:hypothetical protein